MLEERHHVSLVSWIDFFAGCEVIVKVSSKTSCIHPIGSMYGIYANIKEVY